METKTAVRALAALAQETRLSIFRLLVEAGPQGIAVGHVGETLAVPAATLSFHLKELANAGLTSSRHAADEEAREHAFAVPGHDDEVAVDFLFLLDDA